MVPLRVLFESLADGQTVTEFCSENAVERNNVESVIRFATTEVKGKTPQYAHLYRQLTDPSFAKNYILEVSKTGDEIALRVAVDDLMTALCIHYERRRGASARVIDWSQSSAVERRTGKARGAWVFKGTRVPVRALFANLKDGARIDDFLKWVPGVTRGQVNDALKIIEQSLGGRRRGEVGLRKIFAECPRPITPPERIGRKRHVISPATASEIRKTLGITKKEMRNVLRAFAKAGVEV